MDLLNIPYSKFSLKNGLEVILHKNPTLPLVSVNIWYKVGSANESRDKTGLAHLFEHMMFQGSENVEKEMHFRLIQEAGGYLNASTSFDRTNYFEKVPSGFLELVLFLESDRMGKFLPALTQEKLSNQIDVVRNERLERYDNQPYGLAWELLIQNLYPKDHPYSWSTIGSVEHINSFNMNDISQFFQKFYSPSNATLVIAGDIETDESLSLAKKYFEEIPAYNNDHQTVPEDFSLPSKKVIIHEDNVHLTKIYLAWKSQKAYSNSDAELDVISDILSGSISSRLNKKFVYDDQTLQNISATNYSGFYDGHFMISATLKPGTEIDKITEQIISELGKLFDEEVDEKELTRSKNSIISGYVFSMQNMDAIANQLNHYNMFLSEPNSFNYDLNRYLAVTPDRIKKAAKKYLDKPFIQLNIIPKSS